MPNTNLGLNGVAARRIRELRQARGWSLLELGERYGACRNSIHRWELGERPLTLHHVEGIAETLGYTAHISFSESTTEIFRELASVYRDLSPEDQRAVLSLAQQLAGTHTSRPFFEA